MTILTRRRFLTIAASAAALPGFAGPSVSAHWRGVALGAPASMRLEGLSQAEADPIFAAVEREVLRLEDIFSLYRPGSEISRLNDAGRIDAPSVELLEVLSLSASIHHASDGVFDPTVQPLWVALALGRPPAEIAAARARVGWRNVIFDTGQVVLRTPGMALTLNGIAQGMVSDRVHAVLAGRGLKNLLIDMGEIVAHGSRGDSQPWSVGVADPTGELRHKVRLSDRALATSATAGTLLNGATGHILHPDGRATTPRLVAVSAPRAVIADGLSTALCLSAPAQASRIIDQFAGARLEVAT
ncbi:FAD:protein FMN transferase [Ruegeria sp. 2012CJ41-6]|uniref:FAD:protein FMN transferase n=1 Tax=Ruegeria spongiae TaxID=2942209 RepID=A0ABT0PYE2_9RHOB|nr:FAD:protein FMN transferase [Ruegeria spongiae]MCL6282600.1 FAD:protein FMN transferase [Ruegeria spongiae]